MDACIDCIVAVVLDWERMADSRVLSRDSEEDVFGR